MTRRAGSSGFGARAGQVLDRHRTAVLALGSAYLAVVAVAPITTTPYRSDDIVNRRVAENVTGSGSAAVSSALAYLQDWIGPWISEQGRFFPGSATWTFGVFTAFPSREQYKILLAGLALLMIGLTAAVVVTLTRAAVGPLVVVALTSTLTLRTWFDGLDSFSGVIPLTVCLTLGCLLLLLRGAGWPSAVVGGLLWTYALVTYEVAILLTPSLCLIVWWLRRRWTRTLPVLLPAVCVVVLVLVLRARASGPASAYTLNLEPVRVLVTYVKQVLAALPLSEQWFPGGAGLRVETSLVVLTTVLVGVPAALVLVTQSRGGLAARRSSIAVTALVGASLWLLPPLLVAVSLGWQNELPRGQGYVSVVWGYVGVAILAAAGWVALARATGGRPAAVRRLALHASTAVLAVLCALTVAQSVTVAVLVQSGSA